MNITHWPLKESWKITA